ncbi:MAG: TolC family protein [Gemmatimonadota bacterium]
MTRLLIPGLLIGLAFAAPAVGQEAPRTLTLEQAIATAKEGNRPLKAVRQKVEQMRQTSSFVFSNFLPRLATQANYMGSTNTGGIMLPRGSLGNLPELGGAFPPADLNVSQGGQAFFFTYTTLSQPITHFFKIREGVRVARADEVAARANLAKAEQDVAFGVMRAYAGVLIAEQSLEVARVRVTATEQRVAYQKTAVQSGTAIEVAEREARVKWLQARQEVLERQGEVDDLTYALTDALGLPPRTPVKLVMPAAPADTRLGQIEDYVRTALENNPDVLEARALVTKATHGVNAARADYIPEIGVQGLHFYQNSVPFFPKNTLGFGLQGKWTILDFGARRSTIQSRRAQFAQAEYNLTMVEGRVRGEVEGAYRKALRAKEIVELAREGAALRTEAARLRINQTAAGFAMAAAEREATADRMEGALDLVKAELGYRLALAELAKAAGTLART